MKKQLVILLASVFVLPAIAQQTNHTVLLRGEDHSEGKHKNERPSPPVITEDQRKEYMERRYQFMEKVLSDIGVSKEDHQKIRTLQKMHRSNMKRVGERLKTAQLDLSKMLDNDATDEEIEAAIQQVSEAQTAQLRLIVANRREMESLLGREKYALFMENARKQFHQHGRRGGTGMPPRPGLPPTPGHNPKGREGRHPPRPPKLPPAPEPSSPISE